MKAAVIGASGYTGAELLRLLAAHPSIEVAKATAETQAGAEVGEVYPSLAAAYPGLRYGPTSPDVVDGCDVAFLALPHGEAWRLVPDLIERVGHIVDLSADFRLREAKLYPDWYGAEHPAPTLLSRASYGLPELFRPSLVGAPVIAAAGCYVTAAALALAPLRRARLIEGAGVIVDAASGLSGAGKVAKASTHFGTVNESFTAYGLLEHRHTPEIEQAIDAQVLFTPHLAPMTRGILATCYARPIGDVDTQTVLDALRSAYEGDRFIVVSERVPDTKATLGSNSCHLTARVDPRTGWVVVISALDNLVKGASGQAIQCANLALGLDEGAGLPVAALYP